eukprot:10330508-Prorocentrum_lima.AAC.1
MMPIGHAGEGAGHVGLQRRSTRQTTLSLCKRPTTFDKPTLNCGTNLSGSSSSNSNRPKRQQHRQ